MSIFKYTLPSGRTYVVEGPNNATQAQADYIFYSQVASGSLVSYVPGQTLTSTETRLTKFGYSRLDRTTAGTDINSVLAIISGSPVIAATPPLINIPLTNPVSAADIVAVPSSRLPVTPVGPLTSNQTTTLIAQIANLVNQDSNTVSTTKGIGTYGLSPANLEQAGYLKPGTSNYPDFNCVVGTPSVWTGKDGITSLAGIIADPGIQTQIQAQVMNNSYNALVAGGTIQTTPTQPVRLSSGQVYTASGLSSLTAATLLTGTAALTTANLNGIISSSFASAGNISSLLSTPITNINTIASGAVNSITQGLDNLGTNALNTATGAINSITGGAVSQATGAINTATNAINSATSTLTSLSTTLGSGGTALNTLTNGMTAGVAGSVAGLITNASQFGAPVAAAWAAGSTALTGALSSATELASGVLSSATSTINSTLGAAQGAITSALGDLTSTASAALGPIATQAQELLASLGGSLDIFGKMSSFSIDFSLFSSDSLVSPTKVAAGFSNTVNRSTVDAAMQRILGNPKIPVPTFEYPSLGSINLSADIQFAQNKLKELTTQATGAIGTTDTGVPIFSSTQVNQSTVVQGP